jgi:hypothetical protein
MRAVEVGDKIRSPLPLYIYIYISFSAIVELDPFFFFFFIIKNKALLNNKILYNKAHNPTKRETEPYIEGSKSDIRHDPRPYKEGSKT